MCCNRNRIASAARIVVEQVLVKPSAMLTGNVKIVVGKNQVVRVGVGLPPVCMPRPIALINLQHVEIIGPCPTILPAA